jgi:hypothetical protein
LFISFTSKPRASNWSVPVRFSNQHSSCISYISRAFYMSLPSDNTQCNYLHLFFTPCMSGLCVLVATSFWSTFNLVCVERSYSRQTGK